MMSLGPTLTWHIKVERGSESDAGGVIGGAGVEILVAVLRVSVVVVVAVAVARVRVRVLGVVSMVTVTVSMVAVQDNKAIMNGTVLKAWNQ